MAVSFVPNPAFEEQWRITEGVPLAHKAAEAVAAAARRRAPYRLGHLRGKIGVSVGLEGTNVTGRVFDKDFKAHWHEFGTRYMSAHPFLRPALAEALPGATIVGGSG